MRVLRLNGTDFRPGFIIIIYINIDDHSLFIINCYETKYKRLDGGGWNEKLKFSKKKYIIILFARGFLYFWGTCDCEKKKKNLTRRRDSTVLQDAIISRHRPEWLRALRVVKYRDYATRVAQGIFLNAGRQRTWNTRPRVRASRSSPFG